MPSVPPRERLIRSIILTRMSGLPIEPTGANHVTEERVACIGIDQSKQSDSKFFLRLIECVARPALVYRNEIISGRVAAEGQADSEAVSYDAHCRAGGGHASRQATAQSAQPPVLAAMLIP
jgi:hypothetical protein